MQRHLVLGLAALGLLFVGACAPEAPKSQDRVAATVNGQSISLARWELLRARAAAQPGEKADPAKLMDALIDQVLFAQKATKLQLDRRGLVPAALEEATARVLAQAYLEDRLGQPPDAAEITAFYDEHPQLFENRQIFRVFELAVIAPADRVDALRRRAARASSLMELAAWLEQQQLPFNVGGVTNPSEQLAPPLLAALLEMKKGDLRVLQAAGGVSVLQLVHSEAAPLSREAAAPAIAAVLRARKRQEVAERERGYLRGAAAIHIPERASAPVFGDKINAPIEETSR
jgi:EpsD family peptidyl-prolyl cis-trans isomerase